MVPRWLNKCWFLLFILSSSVYVVLKVQNYKTVWISDTLRGAEEKYLPETIYKESKLTSILHIPDEEANNCRQAKFPNFPQLQPEVIEDFPTVNTESPRIPHIIHQTFKTEQIPSMYWENIKSVVRHHPNWTYYFWSDDSARKLIHDKYPEYLQTWDNLDLGIKRADALRYFILYEYGGVYLDMDFEVMRPLDRTTMKYASIIAPEMFEHVAFKYEEDFILMNCIMFSRPGHPFFKYLIKSLPDTFRLNDVLKATGPLFVTEAYKKFYHITEDDVNRTKTDCSSNSPYFYKGSLPEDDENAVYVPNTQYFNDIIDLRDNYEQQLQKLCENNTVLSIIQKRTCVDMKQRGIVRAPDRPFAFTNHKWSHLWLEKPVGKFTTTSIKKFVPNFKRYLGT